MRKTHSRGTPDVEDHLIEKYQDYYRFSEDYAAYERTAVSNFSDMPMKQFNPGFKSSGRKKKENPK